MRDTVPIVRTGGCDCIDICDDWASGNGWQGQAGPDRCTIPIMDS
jgi:hypothetical protein